MRLAVTASGIVLLLLAAAVGVLALFEASLSGSRVAGQSPAVPSLAPILLGWVAYKIARCGISILQFDEAKWTRGVTIALVTACVFIVLAAFWAGSEVPAGPVLGLIAGALALVFASLLLVTSKGVVHESSWAAQYREASGTDHQARLADPSGPGTLHP